MKMLRLLAPTLLGVFGVLACTDPPPAGDAGTGHDANVSDRASGWDRNIGQDTHFTPRDAGPGCGDVPGAGRCSDAGVLSWCLANTVHSFDCTAIAYACAEKPSLGGCWCLAGPGQDCGDWPCLELLICGENRRCSGWPDAGRRDVQGEDGGSEDRGAEDGAGEIG